MASLARKTRYDILIRQTIIFWDPPPRLRHHVAMCYVDLHMRGQGGPNFTSSASCREEEKSLRYLLSINRSGQGSYLSQPCTNNLSLLCNMSSKSLFSIRLAQKHTRKLTSISKHSPSAAQYCNLRAKGEVKLKNKGK